MKKALFLFAAVAFFLMSSCGSSVDVDPNMEAFMKKIDSTNSMSDALNEFAANNDVESDLEYYELKDPTVKEVSEKDGQTCYKMNVKHGIVDSDCNVCWKDGKIVSITE